MENTVKETPKNSFSIAYQHTIVVHRAALPDALVRNLKGAEKNSNSSQRISIKLNEDQEVFLA